MQGTEVGRSDEELVNELSQALSLLAELTKPSRDARNARQLRGDDRRTRGQKPPVRDEALPARET